MASRERNKALDVAAYWFYRNNQINVHDARTQAASCPVTMSKDTTHKFRPAIVRESVNIGGIRIVKVTWT